MVVEDDGAYEDLVPLNQQEKKQAGGTSGLYSDIATNSNCSDTAAPVPETGTTTSTTKQKGPEDVPPHRSLRHRLDEPGLECCDRLQFGVLCCVTALVLSVSMPILLTTMDVMYIQWIEKELTTLTNIRN